MAAAQFSLPLDCVPHPVRAHGLRAPARLRVIRALTLRGGFASRRSPNKTDNPVARRPRRDAPIAWGDRTKYQAAKAVAGRGVVRGPIVLRNHPGEISSLASLAHPRPLYGHDQGRPQRVATLGPQWMVREETKYARAVRSRFLVAENTSERTLPIRLTPMTATCRVPPLSRVKLGIGWSRGVARDAEQ